MITTLIHRDCCSITVSVLLLAALLCCGLVMAQTLTNSDIIVLMLADVSQIPRNVVESLLSIVLV